MKILKTPKTLRSLILYTHTHTHTHTHTSKRCLEKFGALCAPESGRSMVEMLAVLALIGVLSVAGLAGWKMAMTRHYTNILFNEAQKRATIISGQIGAGQTPSLSGFTDNETSAGTFGTDVVMLEEDRQFGIPVSGVEKSVCENLQKNIGVDYDFIQRLGSVNEPSKSFGSCGSDNEFLLIYNNVMGNKQCTKDTDCETVCGVCDHGFCINECEAEDVECTKATEKTDCQGSCVGCVVASGETKGTCQSCTPVEYLENIDINSWFIIPVKLGPGVKYRADVQVTGYHTSSEYSFMFGSRSSGSSSYESYVAVHRKSPYTFLTLGKYIESIKTNGISVRSPVVDTTKRHILEFTGNNFLTDGVTGSSGTGTRYYNNLYTCIFGLASSNTAREASSTRSKFRLYSFWMKDASYEVDLIPVLDWDDKPAMYDKVNNKVYYNKGTGTFKTNLN